MAVLADRTFRLLFLGHAANAVGDGIFPIAIAAFWLERGGAAELGLALGANSLGFVLLSPVGGVLADRGWPVRVIRLSHAIRLLAVLGLLLSAPDFYIAVPLTFAALEGIGRALYWPTYQATIPQVLPDEDLEAGNAMGATALQLAGILGPALGGVLVAFGGWRMAFLADALSFVASGALTVTASVRPAVGAKVSTLEQLREGFRELRRRRWLLAFTFAGAVQATLVFPCLYVLLPVVIEERLGYRAYGLLLAVLGLGAVPGGVVGARWKVKTPGLVASLSLLPIGLLLLGLTYNPVPVLLAPLLFLTGAGTALQAVLWFSGLQRAIPKNVLARVIGIVALGSFAFEPLGFAAVGPLLELAGQRAVALGAVAALIVSVLLPLPIVGSWQLQSPD